MLKRPGSLHQTCRNGLLILLATACGRSALTVGGSPSDKIIPGGNGPSSNGLVVNANGPYGATVGAPISFNGSATESGVTTFTFKWDFGNGATAATAEATYAYPAAGTFQVTLTATDHAGHAGTASTTAQVTASPPGPFQALASANPVTGTAPLAVSFKATASGGTPPYSFAWNFGNGAPTAHEANPTYTYPAAGNYTATLTATDASGQTASANLTITVNAAPAPLKALASANPLSGSPPLAVSFNASASGGTPPYAFIWDLGDGTTANWATLSHTYQNAGSYTATLTVTDASGQKDSATLTITVNTNLPPSPLSFAPLVKYNIGTQPDGFIPNAAPQSVVIDDFDGDAKLDLVVSHTQDNSLYFLKGNGDGTFQPAVQTAIIGEAISGSVYVGDFNGDGKPDLFLAAHPLNSSNNPIIALGNGDGTFQVHIDTGSSFAAAGIFPRGWAVGDYNGDRKLDIVATLPDCCNNGGYNVLLGNGNGTFRPGEVRTNVFHGSRWVATADLNGDGKLDLAVADGIGVNGGDSNAELTILLGNGDGTFRYLAHYDSPAIPSSDTLNPEDVFIADLNKDKIPDVIVCNYDQPVNVYLGNGDGTFQPARSFATGQYPRAVAIADMNQDGNPDLVVDNVGVGPGGAEFAQRGSLPGSVAVLLGNGDGTFQNPNQFTPFFYPGWLAVADFKNNGLPDIVVTGVERDHAVGVMINTSH